MIRDGSKQHESLEISLLISPEEYEITGVLQLQHAGFCSGGF